MNSRFSIDLVGDLDLEGMAIEINFDNQTIARLDYEKGVENIEIEFYATSNSGEVMKFSLLDFLTVVEKAKKLVIKCAKEDEERKSL